MERTGAEFIHPYDNPRIIAGQGTAALELLEEVQNLVGQGAQEDWPVMRALGYRQMLRADRGEMTMDEAVEETQRAREALATGCAVVLTYACVEQSVNGQGGWTHRLATGPPGSPRTLFLQEPRHAALNGLVDFVFD